MSEKNIIEFSLLVHPFKDESPIALEISSLPTEKDGKHGHMWIVEDHRYSHHSEADPDGFDDIMGSVSNDDMLAFCRSLLACCESFEKSDDKLNAQ